MKTSYAGVIGCDMSNDFFQLLSNNVVSKYEWKKVFLSDGANTAQHFNYKAELVDDVHSIVNDEDITVVFLSNKYLNMVPALLKAGKSVRTVSR